MILDYVFMPARIDHDRSPAAKERKLMICYILVLSALLIKIS